MCFHLVDLPICMVPVLLGTEALDPLHHDSSVPGAVKDRDVSCLRHMIPESPEIVMDFSTSFGMLSDRPYIRGDQDGSSDV